MLGLLKRAVRESKKRGPWVSHMPTFSALPCKVPSSGTFADYAASTSHLMIMPGCLRTCTAEVAGGPIKPVLSAISYRVWLEVAA